MMLKDRGSKLSLEKKQKEFCCGTGSSEVGLMEEYSTFRMWGWEISSSWCRHFSWLMENVLGWGHLLMMSILQDVHTHLAQTTPWSSSTSD